MAELSDRQLATFLLIFAAFADTAAIFGFADIVFDAYFIRLGLIGFLGVTALLMSFASMAKYFWNAFSPGNMVSRTALGFISNIILFLIGAALIVALWWVPHQSIKPKIDPPAVSTTKPSQTAPPSSN